MPNEVPLVIGGVFVVGALAISCGASGGPAAAPAPMPEAFKDMNLEQRTEFMKTVVMPRTRELFTNFDPKFKDMDCKTCHGDGVDDGSFELPNPKIKALPGTPEAFIAWVSVDAAAARWATFMSEQLVPAMGEMLKVTPFDPTTETGDFSCGNCHTLDTSVETTAAPEKLETP